MAYLFLLNTSVVVFTHDTRGSNLQTDEAKTVDISLPDGESGLTFNQSSQSRETAREISESLSLESREHGYKGIGTRASDG